MELNKMTIPELRKLKKQIDEKLFTLGNLKFDAQEVLEKEIKKNLNLMSVNLNKEIESRKRKKK